MKNTLKELRQKHARELAKLEKENAIRAELPESIRDSASIYIHSDHASVSTWNSFRTDKKLSDVVGLVECFGPLILTGEHWKSGCVSTSPAIINSYAKEESAVMDGSHVVEVLVSGGKGFGPDVELRFWVNLPSGLIEIHSAVSDLRKLVPHVKANYNHDGELSSCRIDWPVESRCVDSFRTWWSDKPSYRGSYYLADLPNFYSWAGNFTKA